MQVRSLTVGRTASYEEPPNTLQGKVELVGHFGSQTVVLSSSSLAKIFNIIAAEVADSAKRNADLTGRAMKEAADAVLLADNPLVRLS